MESEKLLKIFFISIIVIIIITLIGWILGNKSIGMLAMILFIVLIIGAFILAFKVPEAERWKILAIISGIFIIGLIISILSGLTLMTN